jgi:hypothetical protein
MGRRVLVQFVLSLLILAGCDSSGSSPDNATAAGSIAIGEPAAPGGAAIVVPPGSPKVCGDLAGSTALRDLVPSMTALAVDGTGSPAVAQLRRAAADLRTAAETSSTGAALTAAFTAAADAIDAVVASQAQDPTAMHTLADALTALDREVQKICHFPIG